MQFRFLSFSKFRSRNVFLLRGSHASYVLSFFKSGRIFELLNHSGSLRHCALILVSAFTLQSCSSESDFKNDKEKDNRKTYSLNEKFAKGQIIDSVICINDTTQSYALYLPSDYSIEKKYPIIYAFDPYATGKVPVSLYKKLADQYGYIIAGSNNSKNGTTWEISQNIANKFFADAGKRLSVNTQRIYVLGFSGGARVANALTIINGAITGVICCGASAPVATINAPRNNYTFLGIVGNEDFNYIEMRKYDMIDVAGQNSKHVLITFNGKHEWPAEDIMDDAFWWLELNNMRKNIANKNDSRIGKRFDAAVKQIDVHQQKGEIFESYKLCQKVINFYDGLTDLSYCYSAYKALQTSPEIDKQLKLEEGTWTEEEALRQQYIKAFQTQGRAWWNKNIAALNQKIKSGDNSNIVLMSKRLLGYLSLVAYMQTTGALKQSVLPAAEFYGEIYVLVDPTNNEAHYLMAVIMAKKRNNKELIKSLQQAFDNGFVDIARLQSDEAFSEIKNTKEFIDMIKGIK